MKNGKSSEKYFHMWNNTEITKILNLRYPIIQGPFGGNFSSVRLSSLISNIGGMGSFGLNSYTSESILEINKKMRLKTNNTYALNLWVPLEKDPAISFEASKLLEIIPSYKKIFEKFNVDIDLNKISKGIDFEDQITAVLKASPPVASFIFGIPNKDIIQELKSRKIKTIATATTLEEALLIEESGIDIVVASGKEAGGHRASFLKTVEDSMHSTEELLKKIKNKLNIPIIAAGGISNGSSAYRMLRIGASAVQLGTAFLATEESNASDEHKARLFSKNLNTTLSKIFTGRTARLIDNKLLKELQHIKDQNIAPYPYQSSMLSSLRKELIKKKEFDYIAYWSGQPSSRLKHHSAEKLFKSIIKQIESYI